MPNELERLGQLLKHIPKEDILAFMSESQALYREHLQAQVRIEEVRAATTMELSRIRAQRDLLREAMTQVFAERRDTITRMFDLIEKGLERDDRELVLQGMRSVGQIVSSSPFGDVQAVANMLASNQKIEF